MHLQTGPAPIRTATAGTTYHLPEPSVHPGEGSASMPPEVPVPSGRSADGAFVGRHAELTRMLAAGRDALAGRPAAILVEGPPGIGKSALLREFALHSPEFRAIELAAFPDEADMSYGLITQLALTLKAWGHDPDWARISAEGDPVAVGMALLGSLSAAAAERPVLVLVDDLQSADRESVVVLRFLLRRLWPDRVCVAMSTGGLIDGVAAGILPADAVTVTVPLTGLGPDDLAELVRRRSGPFAPALVERLAEWTGGNPAMAWAVLTDDRWATRTSAPTALGTALRAVAARLPVDCRAILDALSVVRNPASPALVGTIADVDGAVTDLVEPLRAARLVRWSTTDGRLLEFVSSAVREATANSLPAGLRRRLHAAAARAVPGRADQLAHLVAANAGTDPTLARTLSQEADREYAGGDLVRAAQYSLWASEIAPPGPDRAGLLTQAVRLLVRTGRGPAALALTDRVEALPSSWERTEAQGMLAFSRGEPATALQLLVAAAQSCPPDTPAPVRGRLAVEQAISGIVLFSGEQVLQASNLARSLTDAPDIVRLADATGAFGRALTAGPTAALRDLDYLPPAPADCAEHDLTGLTFRGLFRGVVGRFDDAIADLTVAARRREATRVAVFGVTAHIHLAWCQLVVGLWEGAIETVEVATELADIYGRPLDQAALRSSAAVILAWRGDLPAARRELAESQRQSGRRFDYLGPIFHQVLARAAIAWSNRSFAEVVTLLEPWLDQGADRQRVDLFALWWLPILADAQVATGRSRRASATVDRLAALDAVAGSMRDTAVAWLRGRLARREGDLTRSRHILTEEVGRPEFASRPNLYSGLVLLSLAETQLATGDQAAARLSFDSAVRTLDAMGAQPLVIRARERMAKLFAAPRPAPALDRLTDKERQVATLVGRGWTNPEVAKTLFVSSKTVEYHLRNIFIKLNLTDRRELRRLLQEAG